MPAWDFAAAKAPTAVVFCAARHFRSSFTLLFTDFKTGATLHVSGADGDEWPSYLVAAGLDFLLRLYDPTVERSAAARVNRVRLDPISSVGFGAI